MPELPEVESVRESLEPYLIGNKVVKVFVNKPKLVSGSGTKRFEDLEKVSEFIKEFTGESVKSVKRRAKNIMIVFESGKVLLVHLKMTGQLVYRDNDDNLAYGGHPIRGSVGRNELPNKHTHVVFEMEKGTLYYNDTRMFGYLLFYPNMESLIESGHYDGLGYEPTSDEFTFEVFRNDMKRRRGVLKHLFLNQKVVVGLGNIYCDEVCFEAGVRPDRRVESLSDQEIELLYEAITRIIPAAIKAGGSSVANYVLGDGSRGTFVEEHKVYNRGGKECLVCGEVLAKDKIAGRTTVYCDNCQR